MPDFNNLIPPDLMALLAVLAVLVAVLVAVHAAQGKPPPGKADAQAAPDDPTILMIAPGEPLRLSTACSGIVLVAETGGGKTSLIELLSLGLMRLQDRVSFLWVCAKPDEPERVMRLARQAGWRGKIVDFSPESAHRFNALDYEARASGVDGAMFLLDQLLEAEGRSEGQGGERFWEDSCYRHLRNVLMLLWLGKGRLSFAEAYRILTSAPTSAAAVKDPAWRASSHMAQCLVAAGFRHEKSSELELCGEYFLSEWANLSQKTQSVVYTMTVNILSRFVTGPTSHLMSGSEPSTVTPDSLIDEPTILLVNLPYLQLREIARFQAIVWRSAVARAVLRRDVKKRPRHVVSVADEAQLFVTGADVENQQLARSQRLVAIDAFQTLPVLYAALGGSEKARHEAHAWVGGHVTRFIGSLGGCKTSADFFSALCGQRRELMMGGSGGGGGGKGFDAVSDAMGIDSVQAQASFSEQYQPVFRPERFGDLRRGGPPDFTVEMVCHMSGRRFEGNGGMNWVLGRYRQNV